MSVNSRLALGTVQFGLPYGIANRSGQVKHEEARRILSYAREKGLVMLDTAIAYGESEQLLGEAGVDEWKVITKLPPLPDSCTDVASWVRESVAGSLQRLKVTKLYGLLLHRAHDLTGARGGDLYAALHALKERQEVEKVGVSVYGPEELEPIWARYAIDLVQAPFNVIDRRLETSGWLQRLNQAAVEVHTRSAFLQGLLLMPPSARPVSFNRWRSVWDLWDGWLAERAVTPVAACLAFALSHPEIGGVVFGVDSLSHLREILESAGAEVGVPPASLSSNDPFLINPSRWNAS